MWDLEKIEGNSELRQQKPSVPNLIQPSLLDLAWSWGKLSLAALHGYQRDIAATSFPTPITPHLVRLIMLLFIPSDSIYK
ncbi:MAG: hypothetical protein F6K50_21890 [Moorea sp. SIO3I7]|uniref:hypothetical protein n=1 Tax=Moorena sp. SIO3I8 TaxID=2607833 RepID=UPI0013C20571|nr:hypothetical protein [Moorena sp. SIO3I8]NEN98070.1 hypothetical protein [Moorena sp. SIO3I7]NEO10023.1 hypothetical protein [Moorena sp. SIO3I8]